MKKNRIVTIIYLIYICLMFGATFFFDVGKEHSSHALLAWVVFSISCGVSYGYYALYRDVKLFGWGWIGDTFKQLFKKR